MDSAGAASTRAGHAAAVALAGSTTRPPASTRPEGPEQRRQPRPGRLVERQQRGTGVVPLEEAHREHRRLRRDRVRGALEVRPEQRQPAVVDPPRALGVAGVPGRDERAHLGRDLVARDGDDAVAAHREDRERRRVVAGEDGHVARPVAADHRELLDVAARLLDRDDARVLGEPEERVGLDVRARPAGHVVDDDRQAALVGDRAEVGVEHPLVGPVVVGRDDERGVGAQGGGPAGRLDRGAGVVAAGAGDRPGCAVRDGRSATVVTAISMSRSRSAAESVGASPVVPTGTSPSMPARTCHATRRR